MRIIPSDRCIGSFISRGATWIRGHPPAAVRIATVCVFVSAGLTGALGQTVTAAIPAAGAGGDVVAVNPVTNRIYVANASSGTVTVIDGATNATSTVTLMAMVPGFNLAVNTVTDKIYVSGTWVIDGATNTVQVVGGGTGPIAVNEATNKIYVGTPTGVAVFDGVSNKAVDVNAGAVPFAIALNPGTNRIYTANSFSNSATIIDGSTNAAVTVPTGTSPSALAINTTTNKVYISNSNSNTVSVLDGVTNSTVNIPVGMQPGVLAVNPMTNQIYVTNYLSGSVTVIDGASNSTSSIAVGPEPAGIAVNPVTNKIYVTSFMGNRLTVIDGSNNSTATVVVPFAGAVGINSATNRIYVAAQNTVYVIDPSVPAAANAASLQFGPVAQNTIMSLFGLNLSCGGSPEVLVNDMAAEVLGAVSTQINFAVPPGIGERPASWPAGLPLPDAKLEVTCSGSVVTSTTMAVAPQFPAIFTLTETGRGQAAVLNQDGSVNGPQSPAARGSYVSIYGTGFGPLNPPSSDGLARLAATVSAIVGSTGGTANVTYAGEAPGYSSGLQQINIQILESAPTGPTVPLTLVVYRPSTGTASSQDGVTISVQ